jgi:hypothetical protein
MLMFILLLIAATVFVQPSLAAMFDNVDANDIDISPGYQKDNDDDVENEFITTANLVDIELDNVLADKVTFNGQAAKEKGHDWEIKNFVLSPGDNEITVKIEKTTGTTETKEFKIFIKYIDASAPGASYVVKDVTEVSEVKAFADEVILSLGEKNLVLDGNSIADEQNVEISIYDSEMRYRHPFVPASKLYRITAEDDDYKLLKDGTLTLKYDTESFGHGIDTLTVLWFKDYSGDPNRSVFQNLGGKVDTAAKTITVPFIKEGFGFYGVYNVTSSFIDVNYGSQNLNWSNTYIMSLYAKGIMNPLNNQSGSFGLTTWDGKEQLITQGELATMLAKALNLPVSKLTEYNYDYSYSNNNNRYLNNIDDNYVAAAARHGLLDGINISPLSYINREQAAVMITRASNLNIYDRPEVIERINNKMFTDASTISPWMQPYVYAAYRAKYISSVKATNEKFRYVFQPKEYLTRSQAAEMVYKLIKDLEDRNGGN